MRWQTCSQPKVARWIRILQRRATGDSRDVLFRGSRSVCSGEVASIHVGFPSRAPNRRLHPLSRGSTDFALLVDHIRNCRGRNPSELGDVTHRDSDAFPRLGSRCPHLQMAIIPTGRIHSRTSPAEDELRPPIGMSLCGILAISRIVGYIPKRSTVSSASQIHARNARVWPLRWMQRRHACHVC